MDSFVITNFPSNQKKNFVNCFTYVLFRYLPDQRTWIGFRDINGTDKWLDGTAVGNNGLNNWAPGKLMNDWTEEETKGIQSECGLKMICCMN